MAAEATRWQRSTLNDPDRLPDALVRRFERTGELPLLDYARDVGRPVITEAPHLGASCTSAWLMRALPGGWRRPPQESPVHVAAESPAAISSSLKSLCPSASDLRS